jgi:hypothetical protein|tara:strand:- start:7527 stop:8114 length:588 start_codon:yes stop_codon:yes gene_type:complete
MASSIFSDLQAAAFRGGVTARTRESAEWFQSRIKDMGTINRNKLLTDSRLQKRQRFGVGNMYMYFYNPKHRKTLPYYDTFPLSIMVGPAPDGFYGINLHYLAPPLRATLFDELLSISSNKRFDETTKFRLNYELLSGVQRFKAFRPAFKHYLTKQVQKPIALVEASEWELAIFLPTESFKKASNSRVWNDSKKAI